MTLRDRLRADTAPLHDRVDAAYSGLDLRAARPLGEFLRTQHAVLEAMRIGPGPEAEAAEALRRRMAEALRADLHALVVAPAALVTGPALDPTASLYVLLGSSLGTRVLRRRWQDAPDPAVRAADRYLSLEVPAGAWRHLCEDLARRPPEGPEADRIVADAARIFALHLDALQLAAPDPEALGAAPAYAPARRVPALQEGSPHG